MSTARWTGTGFEGRFIDDIFSDRSCDDVTRTTLWPLFLPLLRAFLSLPSMFLYMRKDLPK